MPESTIAIPDGAVLLHIGPHKTGTTAIQGMLADAREDLTAHGVNYPGRRGAHHNEARAVLGRPAGWSHDSAPLPPPRQWKRLVKSAHASSGRTVISSEFFALCDADQRARVIDDLGADRVHLLIAARNPGSIALSNWQQVLRDGKTGHLEDWLGERFRRPEPGYATQGFWSWADAATLVQDWSQVMDLARIRVVVIDETDRALLPTTFEQLLDLPPGLIATRKPPSQNRSLTAPEAELLRQATALTKTQLSWDEFSLFFRTGYSTRLLRERVPAKDEARAVLPPWAAEQAAVEAASSIDRIRASGVAVTGDLENLRKVPLAAESVPVDQIPVELAAEAIAGVALAASRRIRALSTPAENPPLPPAAPPSLEAFGGRELVTELRRRVSRRMTRGARR